MKCLKQSEQWEQLEANLGQLNYVTVLREVGKDLAFPNSLDS